MNRMDALDEWLGHASGHGNRCPRHTEVAEYLRLGRGLRDGDQLWRGRLLQMRHSEDFQTQELLGGPSKVGLLPVSQAHFERSQSRSLLIKSNQNQMTWSREMG